MVPVPVSRSRKCIDKKSNFFLLNFYFQKLSKDLDENLTNNTISNNALKDELEDERQNSIQTKLHNDALENQIDELTKENMEVRKSCFLLENFLKKFIFFLFTDSNKNVKSS